MTMKKISAELIKAAQGEFPIDLLLKNAQMINVFSGEIYRENVAIWDKFIVGFGDYEAKKTIDLDGLFLAPGFIDGHVHTESSMVEIPQFARAVVPRGTTSVVCDPHEIANVMGYDGIRYILESSKYNPLNVFIMLPSCVPSTPFETSGSELRAFDLYPFFSEKWVLGLAEVMNYPGLLKCDPELMDKLKISHSKRIDGHAPGLLGKGLSAYVAAGVASDHECTDVDEARAKLRQGLHIMLREGTAAKNLRDLLPLITCENSHRCFFVTDDRHPSDLIEEGHMDHAIRTAIAEGLSPVTAIQMATLNPARYFMLNDHGAIAPGYFADLVAFESLEQIKVRKVFKNGEHVADNGKPCWDPPERPRMALRSSVNIKWLEGEEFKIEAKNKAKIRVIELLEDQLLTKAIEMEPKVEDGLVVSDPERDLLKLCVIERHQASGKMGYGFVKGFGLREGALAASVAHDAHNVIVVGTSDDDMMAAVIQINKLGGGLVVAKGGKVISDLPLPVAGLMSRRPLEEVNKQLKALIEIAHLLGVKAKDPFMTLSFLALPVIPELKLTDQGLVDVGRFEVVDLFTD
jgi:adenine deaminase